MITDLGTYFLVTPTFLRSFFFFFLVFFFGLVLRLVLREWCQFTVADYLALHTSISKQFLIIYYLPKEADNSHKVFLKNGSILKYTFPLSSLAQACISLPHKETKKTKMIFWPANEKMCRSPHIALSCKHCPELTALGCLLLYTHYYPERYQIAMILLYPTLKIESKWRNAFYSAWSSSLFQSSFKLTDK